MRYLSIQASKRGDMWVNEFETAEAAVADARDRWESMTAADRKGNDVYALKSVNPDEDSEDHLDGDYLYFGGK